MSRAEPLPPCDCLNLCGDDPWLAQKRSRPCAALRKRQAFDARCAQAQALLRNAGRVGDGANVIQGMVHPLLAKLDESTDHVVFWRQLIGAVATLAQADIGLPTVKGLLAATADAAGQGPGGRA